MSIDERLEALTQSMEPLTSLHKDNEQRLGQMMELMTRLGNIVINHEERIEDLEGK